MLSGVKGGGSIASSACCPAGTYWIKGSSVCTDCAAGKYNDEEGSAAEAACTDCSAGQYNDQVGKATCTKCAAGKYSSSPSGQESSDVCKVCDKGRYNEEEAMSECKKCPFDSYNPNKNSTSAEACQRCPEANGVQTVSEPGTSDSRSCKLPVLGPCTNKTVAKRRIADVCTECPQGFHGDGVGTACVGF